MPLPESRDEQFVGTRTIGKQSGASSNAEFASLGRIRLLAFVAGVVFVALTLLVQVLPDGSGAQPITGSLLGSLSLALALVSALVWLWARFSTGARSWPIADFYVICASLAMSLVEVAVFDIGATHLQGIPGLCIWIVLVPLVIPMSALRALSTGLLMASMLPASWFIEHGFNDTPPKGFVAWLAAPFVCAGVGMAVAHQVGGWLARLEQARKDLRKLAGYNLIKQIGSGGGGTVWQAQHRFLAKPAAIKFLDPLRLDPDAPDPLINFENEARTIARLRSPHTIELYDFGCTDDGRFYIVMELLEGSDLQQLLNRSGPLPPGLVVHYLKQICKSLAEAHDNGIVHRDLKPANLFSCRLGNEREYCKVLDFGLARSTQRTGDSRIQGTPAFLAPERRFGDDGIGPEADVYGLGCVAYNLLTGSTPFIAKQIPDMIQHHVRTPVQSLSDRLGAELPFDLEQLVMRCLSKHPSQRPANARILGEALEQLNLPAWDSVQEFERTPRPTAPTPFSLITTTNAYEELDHQSEQDVTTTREEAG